MNAFVWLIGAAFLFLGILAYSGRWKGWIRVAHGFGTYIGFSWLHMGAAVLTGSLALTLGEPRWLVYTLLSLAGLLMLVAIVGFWWMPGFLQPEWFRVLRADATGRGRRR